MKQYDRVWAIVDLDHVVYNIESIKNNLGTRGVGKTAGIIAAVKADAYGHGMIPVAKVIEPFVAGYGVATVDEAMMLKRHGLNRMILVLSTPNQRRFNDIITENIRMALYTWEHAKALSELAVSLGKTAVVHIAVDTGMSRIGLSPSPENADMVARIAALPALEIEGIFTHLAKADESDKTFTMKQADRFTGFMAMLKERRVDIPCRHISNSAGIHDLPELGFDLVRAGISIYGLYPSDEVDKNSVRLQPALQLKSEITYVKTVPPGTPVGYGGTYVTEEERRIATIPVGYGDGYPRSLSNRGYVLIRGQRAPIVGRICMDQMMADVTGIPAAEGDEVTLIGRDGEEEIKVETLAALGGGFHYEIICDLGKRIPRVYLKNKKVIACKDYFSDTFEIV